MRTAREVKASLRVLESVEEANDRQKQRLFEKLGRGARRRAARTARIAVWGLAFKPNTDDMREAPALVLIDQLLAAGATVTAHDPAAMEEARRRLGTASTSPRPTTKRSPTPTRSWS